MTLFYRFLNRPLLVFVFCLMVVAFNLIIKGEAFQVWQLYQKEEQLKSHIVKEIAEIQSLEKKIIESQTASFIRQEATESLDMAQKDALVFIFTE